jgi:hypothetical protein
MLERTECLCVGGELWKQINFEFEMYVSFCLPVVPRHSLFLKENTLKDTPAAYTRVTLRDTESRLIDGYRCDERATISERRWREPLGRQVPTSIGSANVLSNIGKQAHGVDVVV